MAKLTIPEKFVASNGNYINLVRARVPHGPMFHVIREVKGEKGARSFFTLKDAIADFNKARKLIKLNNLKLAEASVTGYGNFHYFMHGGEWRGEVRTPKEKKSKVSTPSNLI